MKFGILGPVELRRDAEVVPIGGARQVALLAFLLLHANRAVSSAQLHEALWSELEPLGAPKRVQMAIARLRKSLGAPDRGADGADATALRTVNTGYLLTVAAGELDADVFGDGVAEGRALLDAGDPAGASRVLREALELWRGPALADVACEGFALAQIAYLEELRLRATGSRIEADLALGRHSALIGELQALRVEHPEREPLCGQLMLALYRCGRQSDALEAYHQLNAHLTAELGLHPGPALQSLQRAILEQARWLDGDTDAPAAVLPDATPSAEPREPGKPGPPPAVALPPTVQTAADGAFVGRDAALAELARSYEKVMSGSRQVILLCGEPGVGKTRLATEFAQQSHAGGAVVLYGRCDEEMLLAYQPFVEALRHYVRNCDAALLAGQARSIGGELLRVVPELAERVPQLAEPLAGDPEGARHRLFEAICALLTGAAQDRPLVLVLDDLHWADTATLLLLKYLARYPRAAKLMVIGTYRDTDVEPDDPISGVLAALDRDGLAERLALGGLDEGAVAELVDLLATGRASAQLQRTVFEQTAGNAFFVVEALRHLSDSGAGDHAETAAGPLPHSEGVTSLIGRRFARLGSPTNRVLQSASVLGSAFDVDTLGRVCELGQEQVVDALDDALRAQIIEPAAGQAGRYTFTHVLMRDVQYEMLTAPRRALLHHRVAVAIEDAHRGDPLPYLAELAYHFGLAGADDLGKAIEYATRAGAQAVGQLAYEQAVAHYRGALELLDAGGHADRQLERCDLTIARGEAERMAGDPAYRRTLLDGAMLAGEFADAERLARAALANSRGLQSSAEGVDHERVAVLRAALDALDERDSALRAGLLAMLAVELVADADWRHRAALADDALAMARRVGDDDTLARVLITRSLARWNPNTLADRSAGLREAWQVAERSGDSLLAAHVAFLGFSAAQECGDLEHETRMLASLDVLAEQLGQPIVAWTAAVARTRHALVVSPPAAAEGAAFAAYELGERAGQPDADIWFLGAIFAARFLRGTLDSGEPNLPLLFEQPGSAPDLGPEFTPSRSIPLLIGAAKSVVLCEVGRLDDARAHFEMLVGALDDLPNDYSTLAILTHSAITCAQLGDAVRAERLLAMLAPFHAQFISTGGSWFGAVTHHLALLYATTGAHDDADAQFAAAERDYERLGARAWLARCHVDWAAALLARGPECDRQAIAELLDLATSAARELDLPGVEARAAQLGNSMKTP